MNKENFQTLTEFLQNKGLASAFCVISREEAKKAIRGASRNRNVKDLAVKAIARDLVDGRWSINGESIIFGINGKKEARLQDGQHRLLGFLESGVEYLVTNVAITEDKFAQTTVDSNNVRTYSNMLQLEGVQYAETVAPALRICAALETVKTLEYSYVTAYSGSLITKMEMYDYWKENQNILSSVKVAMRFKVYHPHISAAMHYITKNKNPVALPLLELFMEVLGTQAPTHSAGNPALELYRMLQASRDKTKPNAFIRNYHRVPLFLTCWKNFVMWKWNKTVFQRRWAKVLQDVDYQIEITKFLYEPFSIKALEQAKKIWWMTFKEEYPKRHPVIS